MDSMTADWHENERCSTGGRQLSGTSRLVGNGLSDTNSEYSPMGRAGRL